ncbi:hypothetical protein NDU88_007193 [Pleurodeles waltl]|uniref:Uncharacterized protein n=1 Tax=Pleurodeles waltl TaxID=8319 RepID=A0AAV7NSI0_PLEWA|nr:hypothetical protein NDU88_007193 [Pleurodeles waltl]
MLQVGKHLRYGAPSRTAELPLKSDMNQGLVHPWKRSRRASKKLLLRERQGNSASQEGWTCAKEGNTACQANKAAVPCGTSKELICLGHVLLLSLETSIPRPRLTARLPGLSSGGGGSAGVVFSLCQSTGVCCLQRLADMHPFP